MANPYLEAVSQLMHTQEQKSTWATTEILIKVSVSLLDERVEEINLAETIGKSPGGRQTTVVDDSTAWFLPKDPFCQNDVKFHQEVFTPHFVRACIPAGFVLVNKGWEKKLNKCVFMCSRGRQHKPHKDLSQERTTKGKIPLTKRPVEGKADRCRFQFPVYWDVLRSRWYVFKEMGGFAGHCGHTRVEPASLRLRATAFGPEETRLQMTELHAQVNPTAISSVTLHRTGIDVEDYQIRDLRKRLRKQNYVLNMQEIYGHDDGQARVAEGPEPTTVDKLLAALQAKKDYSYCFIFADYDSSALKVKKKLRRSFGEVETSELDPNDYNDGIDSMEQASKKFRDALSVTGTGMILLAVAWTSDQSSKKFRMFPEFMSCDTTKSTNSEERSLLLCSGKCSNNNAFTHTWMFLPSECACQWL